MTPTNDLTKWNLPCQELLISAGPCSAESEEQLLETARGLKGCPLSFFRAGIWKPRTRPGSFEGIGDTALPWLIRVRDELGFPVGTEVGTPEHVEACLEHGIDVMWIGARTTVNPFTVQAIADALKGTNQRVFVKNPVNADISLWMGAIERISDATDRVGAIHRGFSVPDSSQYRNPPHWRIPIELRRRMPDIPMICDPSHMCGNTSLIPLVSQEAMDLLYDGLMIEVHPDPSKALSDAKQQLTPAEFIELLGQLVLPHEQSTNRDYQTEIRQLRERIDSVDEELISLIRERMDIVQAMGECKHKHNVSTLQPNRWKRVLATRIAYGQTKGLPAEFVEELYKVIHEEAIEWQEKGLFEEV